MHLCPIVDSAAREHHCDLGHCGEREMKRESGTTFALMRLLVENIEAAIKGAEGRIDSLRKDLRGNMINLKLESETY